MCNEIIFEQKGHDYNFNILLLSKKPKRQPPVPHAFERDEEERGCVRCSGCHFRIKTAAGKKTYCLMLPLLSVSSDGTIRARPLCPYQLEGRRRREGGLGVQQLQFFDEKYSREKLTLPFGSCNWDGPMIAVGHGQGGGGTTALGPCVLSSWKVGEGWRVG